MGFANVIYCQCFALYGNNNLKVTRYPILYIYFALINVIKSEQECFVDEKLCLCMNIRVDNKSRQEAAAQAGVINHSIDTALAYLLAQN